MDLTILAGVWLTCALSGVVPWISAEVAIVGAAAFLPPGMLPLLVAGGATGQVIGKGAVYAFARWAPHRLPRHANGFLERLERYRLHRRRLLPVTAVSAACGFPPFYLVTLACGTLALPVGGFMGVALFGTALRYSILVWGVAALGAATT
jgi:membrane protein YqaA with SNARE-associated domain